MQNFDNLYLNGAWVAPQGKAICRVINPATEIVYACVSTANSSDVDVAVKAARSAFKSWSSTPSSVRAQYIAAIAEGMEARREELASVISIELGMPLHFSQEVQVDAPIEGLRSYIDIASHMDEIVQVDKAQVIKEAIGVCAFINPWNYPLHQLIGKLAPALAAGCTMVVKPSEETPVHAYILAEIIHEAGLPPGVFNLVSGAGHDVGEAMCKHPEVDMISFTGSTGAGVRIAQVAAESIKRVCQELGGKSPMLIAPDADVKKAVEHGVVDVMINSGQTCTAQTRMLVSATHYEEAIKIAKTYAESLVIGDPQSRSTFMGPMCSERQKETVLSYIAQGIDGGARLVTGGLEPPEGCEVGYYLKPTIFADVSNDMAIAREEIFGPVLCMIPYENLDDAIEIANDSEYGLSAGVWAGSEESALNIGRQIRAGQVYINGGEYNYRAPFGGYKQSGNGREWGEAGLEEFIEKKALLM